MERMTLAGLIPTAFERVVLNSTATALNSTTIAAKGSVLRISVETAAARFKSYGGAPTSTTGVVLQNDTTYEMFGFNGTSALRFCGKAGAASVLNVERYRHPGEDIS